MARQEGSIRSWNSTSGSLSMGNRMIVMNCYHLQRSSRTTTHTPWPNIPHSCWTWADTCRWALIWTSQTPMLRQLMSSKTTWQVSSCQGKGQHGQVLQPVPNSSSRVSDWRLGFPGGQRHQNHMSLSQACPLLPWIICHPAEGRQECLQTQAPNIDDLHPPCVQCSETPTSPRWPNSWVMDKTSTATRDHGWWWTLCGGMNPG